MSYHVIDQTDFKTKLSEAADKLVLVDFFATWCGPCKMISPKLEMFAEGYKGILVVLKVDVDECEELAIEYNIHSMPTFLFIKNGTVLETLIGANPEKLQQTIQKYIEK